MSGGISQLIAVGAQDVHLVGNPEVSYFKTVYAKHTNFSHTVEQQVIVGNPAAHAISSIKFENKGDLLSYVYITPENPSSSAVITDWEEYIEKVELLIGGQVIDEQDTLFTERIAIDAFAQNVSKSSNGPHPGSGGLVTTFYPLRFFFCENWQSALPLVALSYHDVEIRITWGVSAENFYWKAWANYVYLDTVERSIFSEKPMDMLIYQVQKNKPSNKKIQELVFNHPVKFLASSNTTPTNSLTSLSNKIKLQINGVDICDFKYAQPHFVDVPAYYHTNYVTSPDTFLYPFCLNTASLQPSGTLNFSRLDSARIISETNFIIDPIYAVNYNILRIENGMGGLMYAD
jgi:hypothetical protein